MIKRMVIMLVAVGIVFGGLYGFQAFKARMIAKAVAGMQNPPQTVSSTVAHSEEWQTNIAAVCSTRAIKGADLSAQVSGIVSALHFQSGTRVEKGDLLVQLTRSRGLCPPRRA